MKSRFIKSFDRTGIHYYFKKGKKKPMVFVHGLGGNFSIWKYVFLYFQSRGHTIISIDLRGHGLSEKPSEKSRYSISNASRDLEKVLEKEGIDKAVFICHCFGAYPVLKLYERNPGIFEKIVLLNSHIKPKKEFRIRTASKAASLGVRTLGIFHKKKQQGAPNWSDLLPMEDINPVKIAKLLKYTSLVSLQSFFDEMSNYDGELIAGNIEVPVLIVHGTKDKIVNYKNSKRLHSAVGMSSLVLFEGSNHAPLLNCPDKLNVEISNFVTAKGFVKSRRIIKV